MSAWRGGGTNRQGAPRPSEPTPPGRRQPRLRSWGRRPGHSPCCRCQGLGNRLVRSGDAESCPGALARAAQAAARCAFRTAEGRLCLGEPRGEAAVGEGAHGLSPEVSGARGGVTCRTERSFSCGRPRPDLIVGRLRTPALRCPEIGASHLDDNSLRSSVTKQSLDRY